MSLTDCYFDKLYTFPAYPVFPSCLTSGPEPPAVPKKPAYFQGIGVRHITRADAVDIRKECDTVIAAFDELPAIAPGKRVKYTSDFSGVTEYGVVAHPDTYHADVVNAKAVWAYWSGNSYPTYVTRSRVTETTEEQW